MLAAADLSSLRGTKPHGNVCLGWRDFHGPCGNSLA